VTGRPLGVLRVGGAADVVVLDDALEVRSVFVGGAEPIAA
jgi:N-acetylglucosamine-6-phosphate deacetylase